MYLEATVDSGSHIHAIGVADVIGTENLAGYQWFGQCNIDATTPLGGASPLLDAGRLVVGDGNVAIPASLQQTRGHTHYMRDGRHHVAELPQRLRDTFRRLKFMPRGRRDEVDRILAQLKSPPDPPFGCCAGLLHGACVG